MNGEWMCEGLDGFYEDRYEMGMEEVNRFFDDVELEEEGEEGEEEMDGEGKEDRWEEDDLNGKMRKVEKGGMFIS